jgi:hypothetical protein
MTRPLRGGRSKVALTDMAALLAVARNYKADFAFNRATFVPGIASIPPDPGKTASVLPDEGTLERACRPSSGRAEIARDFIGL